MKITTQKLIKTNKELELFCYQDKPLSYDFTQPKRRSSGRVKDEAEKLQNRQRSLLRSRSKLRRLVNANVFQWLKSPGSPFLPLFLTLTFKEAITDLQIANYELTKFIQRLNHYLGHQKSYIKYLVVPEIQKKREQKYGVGVWHFHLVIFNMPKIERIYDVLNKLWTNGHMLLKSLNKVDNIGNYISKYMSKDKADARLIGNKAYFCSRGLKQPEILRDELRINQVIENLPPNLEPFVKEYQDEYYGIIVYKKYLLPYENYPLRSKV